MLYRVTLDSTLLTDLPDGLEDMQLIVERDKEIEGLFYRYSSSLEFVGDGYTILKALFDNGYCALVDVLIEWKCEGDKDFTTLFEGLITLSKVRFNLTKCIAEANVTDNTISARIVNNWRVKGVLQTDRSVNSVAITPATQTALDFFTPGTGVFTDLNRAAFSVFECFRFLIDYVTDGQVDFASSTFGSGGDWEHLYVVRGAAIRDGATYWPVELNLDDLYTEIDNKIPLGIWVEDNAGTPRVRIEERSYFYGSTNLINCRNIGGEDGLIAAINEDDIYSVIQLGCETTTPKAGTWNYPDIRWQGWTKEEYGFATNCNLDNPLELISNWLMDSNTIESIVVNSVDDFDDDIFLVEGRFNSPNYEAIPYSDAITTYYYNRELTNYKVAQRWADYIPASFQKWLQLSTVDNLFQANIGADSASTTVGVTLTTLNASPYPFDNEVYDNGANYDSATNFRYTAPADGLYTFRVYTRVTTTWLTALRQPITITCKVNSNDGGGVLDTVTNSIVGPQNRAGAFTTILAVWTGSFFTDATFALASGEWVDVTLEAQTLSGSSAGIVVKADSYFECISAPDKVIGFDLPAVPRLRNYTFSYPLSKSQWDTILGTLNGTITINPRSDADEDEVCHIQNISYRPNEGMADFELIA